MAVRSGVTPGAVRSGVIPPPKATPLHAPQPLCSFTKSCIPQLLWPGQYLFVLSTTSLSLHYLSAPQQPLCPFHSLSAPSTTSMRPLDNRSSQSKTFLPLHNLSFYLSIYLYIYIYVFVCIYVCMFLSVFVTNLSTLFVSYKMIACRNLLHLSECFVLCFLKEQFLAQS